MSDKPIRVTESFFQYKYCVVAVQPKGKYKFDHWAWGINRIADLRLLEAEQVGENTKKIMIHDVWDKDGDPNNYEFNVRFGIHDPFYNAGDEMWLEHAGNSNFYFEPI